jgi:hypothetical protein
MQQALVSNITEITVTLGNNMTTPCIAIKLSAREYWELSQKLATILGRCKALTGHGDAYDMARA